MVQTGFISVPRRDAIISRMGQFAIRLQKTVVAHPGESTNSANAQTTYKSRDHFRAIVTAHVAAVAKCSCEAGHEELPFRFDQLRSRKRSREERPHLCVHDVGEDHLVLFLQCMPNIRFDTADRTAGVVLCRRAKVLRDGSTRRADGPGVPRAIPSQSSRCVSLSLLLSLRWPTAVRIKKIARNESCAQEIQAVLREALHGHTPRLVPSLASWFVRKPR